MPSPKLSVSDTLLLVIDLQERLAAAMEPTAAAALRRNAVILIEGAKALGLPVLATEQYPKGLGPTLPDVAAVLPADAVPFAKTSFSCVGDDAIRAALDASGRRQVVAFGVEAHVCVFQTVRDLVASGREVFVPVDAVLSRTPSNTTVGLDLARASGATLTSVEAVLFDLLGAAGGDAFRAISRLVK